jgi:hypothetical protein
VRAVLEVDDRDRWQLGHLVAPRTPAGHLLTTSELVPATTALLGIVVDDLLHLILA